MVRKTLLFALAIIFGAGITATANATVFKGTLYFTHYSGGGPNVLDTSFNYDSSTHALTFGTQVGLSTVAGADGIMFAPNGNLVVTSNTYGNVYRINAGNGALLQTVSTGTAGVPDYHMALDPSGTKFYSSNRYGRTTGPLDTFTINGDGSFNGATTTPITDSATGGSSNVTQLAFAPNGKVFYTDGIPNCCGSVGLFNFGSPNDTTTQLFSSVGAAHGIIYDPFTQKMTMFGGTSLYGIGQVATLDPTGLSNADIINSLSTYDVSGVGTFDQGAVDGYGHAFIAGGNSLTFIDYSQSHDITNPDFVAVTPGFGYIDDIAPLVGLGSNTKPPVPGPASVTLLAFGLAFLGVLRRRNAKL